MAWLAESGRSLAGGSKEMAVTGRTDPEAFVLPAVSSSPLCLWEAGCVLRPHGAPHPLKESSPACGQEFLGPESE